jgi:regulator of replication initiation timing
METEQKRELEDVYRELDQLYAENTTLKRENEDLKRKTHGEAKDTAEVEELKLEIVHLKREAANVYILLDENKELREQLASPMDENAFLSELSTENERLKNRINALEERLFDLKRTSRRPQTSSGPMRPRTSAGRSTSLLEVAEEDDELDAIMTKSSQSLQQMREWIREMQGER